MSNRTAEFLEYETPDGVTYNLDGLESRWVLTEDGFGLPSMDFIAQKGYKQHGESYLDYRLKPRIIQLLIGQKARNRAEYWDMRAMLIDILRPNRAASVDCMMKPGILKKFLPNGKTRSIYVYVEQGPGFAARDLTKWAEWSFQETIRFVATDPTFFDPTLKSLAFNILLTVTGQLVFPCIFPIIMDSSVLDQTFDLTYAGNWMSFPEIVITGPVHSPTITNNTTGEYLKINKHIFAGEVVTVSLQFNNKSVVSDVDGDITGSCEGDLDRFHIEAAPLAPGGVNQIRVTGSSVSLNTDVTVYWYDKYVGI